MFHYIKDNYTTKTQIDLTKTHQDQQRTLMEHLGKIKYQEEHLRDNIMDPDSLVLYDDPVVGRKRSNTSDFLLDVLMQEGGI